MGESVLLDEEQTSATVLLDSSSSSSHDHRPGLRAAARRPCCDRIIREFELQLLHECMYNRCMRRSHLHYEYNGKLVFSSFRFRAPGRRRVLPQPNIKYV